MPYLGDDRARWISSNLLPYEPALRRQIERWNLPDDLDADDIVQECYGRIAAMDRLDEIRHARSYFMATARSVLLMHLRRARIVSIRAVGDLEALNLIDDNPSPETHVSDREQLHLLAKAIARLTEPGRKALLLRVVDELSYRQIGNRFGISENAAQKIVAKTLRHLMDQIGRGGNSVHRASMGHRQPEQRTDDGKARK